MMQHMFAQLRKSAIKFLDLTRNSPLTDEALINLRGFRHCKKLGQ
jgi:hypothetical protein